MDYSTVSGRGKDYGYWVDIWIVSCVTPAKFSSYLTFFYINWVCLRFIHLRPQLPELAASQMVITTHYHVPVIHKVVLVIHKVVWTLGFCTRRCTCHTGLSLFISDLQHYAEICVHNWRIVEFRDRLGRYQQKEWSYVCTEDVAERCYFATSRPK